MFESGVGKWISPCAAWASYRLYAGSEQQLRFSLELVYGLQFDLTIDEVIEERDYPFFAQTQRKLEQHKRSHLRRFCKRPSYLL